MKTFTIPVLAALSTTVSAIPQSTSAATCHDYVLVSIRGTGEPQGPSVGLTGMISQTLTAVPNGIEYDVVYPAARNQTFQSGSLDAVRYITAGLSSCPNQVYALLGYSQGASTIMGALMKYTDNSSALYKALKAIVVIGNPYHVPNASVNVDQFGGDTTRKYPGIIYNADQPIAQGIPSIYYHDGKLLDICFQADLICAPAYPNASVNAHLAYIGNAGVQSMGAKHLIAKLTESKSAPGTGSNSTSPSGTSGTVTPTFSGPAVTSPIVIGGSALGARVSGVLAAAVIVLTAAIML